MWCDLSVLVLCVMCLCILHVRVCVYIHMSCMDRRMLSVLPPTLSFSLFFLPSSYRYTHKKAEQGTAEQHEPHTCTHTHTHVHTGGEQGSAEEHEGSPTDGEGEEASSSASGEEKKKEGACCDLQGNCRKCEGPDEDYNMWENLLLFPG